MAQSDQKAAASKAAAAGISGGIYGAIVGALIGYSFAGGQGAWIGALFAGLYMGFAEAITGIRRQPGELKPLWHRTVAALLFGAALAVAISLLFKDASSLLIGLSTGILIGMMGFGPRKLVLGASLGLIIGLLVESAFGDANPALIGGLIMLLNRLFLIYIFKETEPLQVRGENVPSEDLKYVVPFEAHTGYIGADYAKTLARENDGAFKRNVEGIGIVETLNDLRGPTFDPSRVNPLIREFYEHTSRFKLTIIPEWNPLIRPFFWMFKTFVAQKIGQANLPFNIRDAQRGMVSYIDTIDYRPKGQAGISASTGDFCETLRVWIRAYEDSGEAIYVGIYTIVRHQGAGYVSVGFPLPEANFTATLMPFNNRADGLLLSSRTNDGSSPIPSSSHFTGHFLSDINEETGALTTLELSTMDEEIDVFVQDGQIHTEHRFFFAGSRFLTLHYTIVRS